MSDHKWWEHYTVRYLVGTIVGAGLVVLLNQHSSSPYKRVLPSIGELGTASFNDFVLFAAIGFAFCYISSGPILTVHAIRIHLRVNKLVAKPSLLFASLAAVAVTNIAVFSYLPAIPSIVLASVLSVQVFLLVVATLTRFRDVESLYVAISKARAKGKGDSGDPQVHEYLESYRHLREHGNAMLILVMEALLAFVLFNLPSREYALPVLLAWILPATSSWVVGTLLELRLAYDKPF